MTAVPLAGRRVLEGKRILVTRAAHQAGKLSEGLRALGAEPVEVPVLEIQPPESYEALDDALTHLGRYDWLIFTSANAIPIIHVRLIDLDVPSSSIHAQVAAIGNATAQAVDALLHLKVSITPPEYVAESLVAQLAPQIGGKRVLLARAAIARDLIPDALRAAGAEVDVVDAYTNVLPAAAPEQLRNALAEGIDAATFTSSSSVTHLADAARAAGLTFPSQEFARSPLARSLLKLCALSAGSLRPKRRCRT
jgi:uroporphyrinogen-III synthase